MKAVSNYKAMIEELSRMAWIFARFQDNPLKEAAKEQGWTLETISKIQGKVQASTDMANKIKDEIIGDGDEAKFVGRTKTTFFELNGKPSFAPSYYPEFDEACFDLPSKEHPDRNKELADALLLVYGDDAAMIMVRLGATFKMANFIVQDVCSMLDEVCKFVGYTPEPQQGEQQPQQKDLHYYCLKAVEKGYLVKVDGGYKRATWSKALLAYFLKHFLNTDGTFPDKEYCVMFGESRLSKAADQLSINKNGDGKPRGYEIVDELLQE